MSTKKILMKGNEVIAESAILAGCHHYFGYPITPQSELTAYLAKNMPKRNGVFVQAESEVAAINMVYGSGGTGVRVMTSSSSPGVSLKQEGLSYIACAEVPCLVINVVRSGPGLGNIAPAQCDYFQAVKGGGHGDYRLVVLSPSSVQEMADFTFLGFELADKYRTPVMILSDGYLGQMMEPVTLPNALPESAYSVSKKPWATTGAKGRKQNLISSIHLEPEAMEEHIKHLYSKYAQIEEKETIWEEFQCEDAEYVIVAYGIVARICKSVCTMAREKGIKIGLIRPKTLWPYPTKAIKKYAESSKIKGFMAVELSMGQMVEDVRLAVNGKKPVEFYGRTGGVVPSSNEVFDNFKKAFKL
ncbi:MAG: 3-methyl-2-oxobutanoate dehydrogenase subunit VorB [Candidatus Wallbacteria bacterium]